jgi:MFS transporter, DHA1 family, tetracycline resistance protein
MSAAPKRQAAIIFIFITLFIDIVGIGIVIPVLPELIKQFVAQGEGVTLTTTPTDVPVQPEVPSQSGTAVQPTTTQTETAQLETGQTETAGQPEQTVDSVAGRWYGILAAVYSLMQFIFAPILGALSDRFGRRPIILISLFGLGVDYLILAFAPTLAWLFVGRVVAGIMGASITAANAYIADISTPENRAQNFGLVGVAFGLGFIFGPVLGGLLGGINIHLPFFVAAGLVFVNLLYGFFVLPESLKPENRRPFSWANANPVSSLLNLRKYPLVANLAVAFLFIYLAQGGLQTVWVLYTGYRFGWDTFTVGWTLGLVGVTAAIVQGGLIRPIISRLGERRAVLLGLGVSVLSFLFYGLSYQGWMMIATIIIGALAGVAGPAIQGLVAGSVDANEQGTVQGALTSLLSLTSIISPLVFTTGLFSYFTSSAAPFILPGAPFLFGAVLNLIAVLVVMSVFRKFPPKAASEVAEPAQAVGGIH